MILENIRLSEIKQVLNIHSENGKKYSTSSRPMYGLTFCKSGEIVYTQNGTATVQKAGSVLLLPKNACYILRGVKTGDFPVINFECFKDFGNGKIKVFEIKNNEAFLIKFQHLKNAFESGQNKAKTASIFYEIVSDIIESNAQAEVPITPAIDYINENYTSMQVDNNALAAICGISEVYFRKLFKKICSVSPKQYIINLQLQKAKTLLCEHNQTITEISEECGFSSVYHFCRIFKQKTGVTTGEYKKNNIW